MMTLPWISGHWIFFYPLMFLLKPTRPTKSIPNQRLFYSLKPCKGYREEDMDMIRDNLHGIYPKFIVLRYLKQNLFEPAGIDLRKYLFQVLWYPYQKVLGIIDRMRASLDWGRALHYFSAWLFVKPKWGFVPVGFLIQQ